tara:strand:+ start:828 stop:1043 length:216 start_codon:yes stop_codon:yes gene_type:complete
MAKKKKNINDMSKDQLADQIDSFKKDLFNLKIEILSGQLADTSRISKLKKDIARAKTLISKFNKKSESSNA